MALTVATVNTAIEKITTTGQSYSLDGVSFSKANLSSLIELRDKLILSEAKTNKTRPTMRGFSFNAMGYG